VLKQNPESADEKNRNILLTLRERDPRHDKKQIENDKGDVLASSCDWVFRTKAFHTWWSGQASHLLWIKGDPGKGKTMIALAAISEIEQRKSAKPETNFFSFNWHRNVQQPIIAFFFFKNEDTAISTAVSALRGLLSLIIDRDEKLVRHVKKRVKPQQNTLFQGSESFDVLEDILSDIVRDSSCPDIYLVVDALDECRQQQAKLLSLIAKSPTRLGRKVRWLVTSRNERPIEEALQGSTSEEIISLELNAKNVKAAVTLYIDKKVNELSRLKGYSRCNKDLEQDVRNYLNKNAESTFLWVALVCQNLRKVKTVGDTMSILSDFPPGLLPLYQRMVQQMEQHIEEDSSYEQHHGIGLRNLEHCKQILTFLSISFRPPSLHELGHLAGIPLEFCHGVGQIEDLVHLCGSFLTIRNNIVSFVHLSASEFFTKPEGDAFLGIKLKDAHHSVFKRSQQ
jgi:hypothetical protein